MPDENDISCVCVCVCPRNDKETMVKVCTAEMEQ